MIKTSFTTKTIIASAVVCGLMMTAPSPVFANSANWTPTASEKLVKMPSSYLKKTIDRDFASSPLAAAISENTTLMTAKKQSLQDLEEASQMAEGELQIELKHQYLAEKQAYIRLMGERQEMQRQQAQTQIKFYASVLKKLERNTQGNSPESAALTQQREDAQARFQSISASVDMTLFSDTNLKQSKYSKEYTKNDVALKQLAQAIQNHPMSQTPVMAGEVLSKQEYLKRLILQGETDLALLGQKDELLGYMAKLVALDAMALADEVEATQMGEMVSDYEEGQNPFEPSENIALFLN